jgi:hypothetical protein
LSISIFTDKLALLGRLVLKTIQRSRATINAELTLPSSIETKLSYINLEQLNHFHQVVGWPLEKQHWLHPCYLHTLAFPLHLKLMLQNDFPFPLLGLVHVSNQIEQFRALKIDEGLVLRCYLSELSRHAKGWTFSIITEARVNNELVWCANSKNLFRTNFVRVEKPLAEDESLVEDYAVKARWHLETNLGRRYAKVSGDYNPIHLYPWLAGVFGFKRHIAHGMWSKAKCLSMMADKLKGSFVVNVDFKKPIFLPADLIYSEISSPVVGSDINQCKINFTVSSSEGQTAHLVGVLQR